MAIAQPEPTLLRKARSGDEQAFAILMRTYERPVLAYVARLVRDQQVAEDLTQDIFFRVFQALPRFDGRAQFTTWLFQIAKNRVLDELRARDRRPRATVQLDDAPYLEVTDAPIERAETIQALWRAVDSLSDDLKMALLLRDVLGFSYREIAETLEVTLATVKWRIYKAREDVQSILVLDGVDVGATAKTPLAPAAV